MKKTSESNHFKVSFFRYITWEYQSNDWHTKASIFFMDVLPDIYISLSPQEKKYITEDAKVRILVQQVIRHLNIFRIISNEVPTSFLILVACSA